MLFTATSCKGNKGVFTYCEMSISLGEDFSADEHENFDAVYTNDVYIVAVLRISFMAALGEGIEETMTPYEFGKFYVEKCNRPTAIVDGEVAYCEYTDISGSVEYYYVESFYRSPYAYFVILFAAPVYARTEAKTDFIKYAQTVNFKI